MDRGAEAAEMIGKKFCKVLYTWNSYLKYTILRITLGIKYSILNISLCMFNIKTGY